MGKMGEHHISTATQAVLYMPIQTKRIYEEPDPEDGTRVLVDRLWPRGVSKEDAALDRWAKDAAPSDELRNWFDHDPDRWDEFEDRYRDELSDRDVVDELRELADDGTVTLLYAATDREHNNAVVLRDVLESE